MESKISSASCKIPAFSLEENKKEKNCEMEPWFTRHMYVHVGGHGDFLRLIFSRAIEKLY